MTSESSDARSARFEEWQHSFVIRRVGVLGWIATGILGAYLIRNAVTFGWTSQAVAYRSIGLLMVVLLLAVHRTRLVSKHINLAIIAAAFVVAAQALVVDAMHLPTTASNLSSFYFISTNSLILIFLLLALTVPARWLLHVTVQVLAISYFRLSSPQLFEAVAAEGQLSSSLFNLFWICVGCDASVYLYGRLQRSEFNARSDLQSVNSELEGANLQLEEVARTRKRYLDGLVRIGISATSADPVQQARSALDEMIRMIRADRGFLYLLDEEDRLAFQLGRDGGGNDTPLPAQTEMEGLEDLLAWIDDRSGHTLISVPLRMREHSLGAIRLEKAEASGSFSAADEDFIRATASHVAVALETVQRTQEIRLARDQALEAGRVKDAFLGTMSHEIRTPLNQIIGYSEMVIEDLSEADDLDRASEVRKIHDAARHLLSILTDILVLTQIQADRFAVKVEPFSVRDLAAELESEVRPLADRHQNRFELVVGDDVGVMTSDRTRIGQVLLKLLENACKFTDHGQVSCHISRVLEGETDGVRFSVSDSGIGMTEDQVGSIFEPFYQGDTSSTRAYGGTGLGLTIAHELSHLLGGPIEVRSRPDEGSIFTVTFPVALDSKRQGTDRVVATG